MISVDLYARVRLLLFMHTRPRVHRAPGIPARPLHLRGGRLMASLEQPVLRDREPVSQRHSHVSTSLRGALATKQSTLASSLAARWIASLTLAMTFRVLKFNLSCHHPRRRVIQYAETAMIKSKGCGAPDAPHARGMTTWATDDDRLRGALRLGHCTNAPPHGFNYKFDMKLAGLRLCRRGERVYR